MSDDIRTILHGAYALIRSKETATSIASLTLDHLIQEQIDTLKQGGTQDILNARGEPRTDKKGTLQKRPSRWDEIDALEKSLDSAVKAIKDAGDDPQKLQQLGLSETDGDTRTDDELSVTAESVR